MLAGGLGTRLRPLTLELPKPLVRINGTPFLGYLLQKISSMGIREVVMLVSYKGEMIEDFCKDGKNWGIKIRYLHEDEPLGTGGAILKARNLINKTALIMNGDSYLDIGIGNFLAFHRKNGALATIYSLEGDLEGRGAIEAGQDGRVSGFFEKQKTGRGFYNTGTYLIEPAALEMLAQKFPGKNAKFSMEKDGFPILVEKRAMYAHKGRGKFLDIGTFSALAGAHQTLFGSEKKEKAADGAIFIDRDGVINKNRDTYVTHPDELEFEEGAIEGLKALCTLGLPLFIVTNQSIIGRGLATKETLQQIHDKMLAAFVHHNIKITDILICPHAPDEMCECRKPNTGMLIQAQKKYGADLEKSFVIGDATSDMLMANNAGCTSILVKTGHAGKDARHLGKADYEAENLPAAAALIKKLLGK